jgi:hypothetical protein
MPRYPTITSLLEPELLPAYKVACWLVSSDPADRRSGRTRVLAAAHLRETVIGRSSKLWDHSAPPERVRIVRQELDLMASDLGLTLDISADDILRKAVPPSGLSLNLLRDEETMGFELMKMAVKAAYRTGATKEEIMVAAAQAVHEEAVVLVHDR